MAHGRSWTNGFMGALGFLLFFVGIWRLRKVWIAILRLDVLANFCQRIIGDTGRISSHVGDQTNGAFLTQLHAFVEALRDHHCAFHAEAQLAGGILLQLAGGERWGRIAAPFFAVNRPNQPVSFLHSGADFLRFVTIRNLNFLFALAEKTSIERWRFAGCKMRINGPVFFLFERLDLALAFDNKPESDGLYATSRQTAAHLVPQQWRNLIADETIEHAPRLLRVHKIFVNISRVLKSLLHGALGNLVKGHAADALGFCFPLLL